MVSTRGFKKDRHEDKRFRSFQERFFAMPASGKSILRKKEVCRA